MLFLSHQETTCNPDQIFSTWGRVPDRQPGANLPLWMKPWLYNTSPELQDYRRQPYLTALRLSGFYAMSNYWWNLYKELRRNSTRKFQAAGVWSPKWNIFSAHVKRYLEIGPKTKPPLKTEKWSNTRPSFEGRYRNSDRPRSELNYSYLV